MRYFGQGAEVPIAFPYRKIESTLASRIVAMFEESYKKLYGRTVPGARPQVITWRLTGRAQARGQHFEWGTGRAKSKEKPATRSIFLPLKKTYGEAPVYDRYSLAPGTLLEGPLILEERECTIVVPVKAQVKVLPDLTVSVGIQEFD
jgi:N-methylhydantoinase A